MKVVYKKKITDQILDASFLASRRLKEIDYITVTETEWRQLYHEVGYYGVPFHQPLSCQVFGITINKQYEGL